MKSYVGRPAPGTGTDARISLFSLARPLWAFSVCASPLCFFATECYNVRDNGRRDETRKEPAWQRLVGDGLVASREEAERWILAGKVRAAGQPILRAGDLIARDAQVEMRGLSQKYVAKGGMKLEGALAAFGVDVSGRVCLDAGASTGGFTDCLVQRGAARVYAVDVGFGQLAGSLRLHPSVVNLERTNIGDTLLSALDPPPTVGTVDLSYLSLRKAVPLFARALRNRGDLICLVKPLFEIDDATARRTGEVPDGAYVPLLVSLAGAFDAEGYAVRGLTHSPVTGNNGTLEFFIWLSLDRETSLSADERAQSAQNAVESAMSLPAFTKYRR